jgi:hypothetical protein
MKFNWFAGGFVVLLFTQTLLADEPETVAAAPVANAVEAAPVNPDTTLNETDAQAQKPEALTAPEERVDSQKQALAQYQQTREIARHRRHHRRHRRHHRRHRRHHR